MPHGLGCGKRSALRPRPPKPAPGGAVNKRPQAAARDNHRRHSAPLRAPHRVGTIHYATQRARAASGARRALRRACSGKWQMGGYINPRLLAGFDI